MQLVFEEEVVLTRSKIENANTGKTTTIYEANIIGVE